MLISQLVPGQAGGGSFYRQKENPTVPVECARACNPFPTALQFPWRALLRNPEVRSETSFDTIRCVC